MSFKQLSLKGKRAENYLGEKVVRTEIPGYQIRRHLDSLKNDLPLRRVF
ncbi:MULTISPECIES: hypothetical protein [unclassified Pseudomonas]|nr:MULTISPECIES: hypothetical protein [unclassified Pseudomonas]